MEAMRFSVCVHDVHPRFAPELSVIIAALRERLGERWSAGVVPLPDGKPWADRSLLELLSGAELLLHGCTHRRHSRSPVARWLGGADELVGLTAAAAAGRIARGVAAMTALTGEAPRGFLPPAWRMGAAEHPAGLDFVVRLDRLVRRDGTVPLATFSWDVGPLRSVGWLGEGLGALLALSRQRVPCIALHPADVRRGFLPRALERIDALSATHAPARFEELPC